MKIAVATASLGIHGIATFTLHLSQWLQAAGHHVTVVTVMRGERWSRLAELGIEGHCIAQQPWDSVVSHVKRLAAWLTKQSFDILLVNVGSIYSRPLQLCLHLLPDTLPVVILLRNDHGDVYDVAAINGAAWHCAVAVSPGVQQRAALRFRAKPVHCIPNGVALPTDEQLSQRLDWATPLRLLFVGRLEDQQKGVFRLPAILAACRRRQIPVRLTILGDGPDRTRLHGLFTEAGVGDLVDLAGFQPHDVVLAAMRTHHILLMPSNYEGFPNVLLEAQANGCVPIAARLPGVTDRALCEGVSGILVNPADVDGFVVGIERLTEPAIWRAFSTAGRAFVQQHFSLQRMGERYLQLFHTLVQGGEPLRLHRSALPSPFHWQDSLPAPIRRRIAQLYKQPRLVPGFGWLLRAGRGARHWMAYGVWRKLRADWLGFRNYLRYRTLPHRSDRLCRKTILVMDNRLLRPEDSTLGRSNDSYNRLLQQMDWQVLLMPYLPGWDGIKDGPHGAHWDEPYAIQVRQQGFVLLAGWFFRWRRQSWLQHNGAAIDRVLFRSLDAAEAYLPLLRLHSTAKVLFLATDLPAVRKQREYEVTADPLAAQAAQRFAEREDTIFRAVDGILTFSHEEATWLRQQYGEKVFHLPLFFYTTLPNRCPTPPMGQTMLFVGNFAHPPNPDGLRWFVQSCLPLIVQQCPVAKLVVVGTFATPAIFALQSTQVDILGRVSDEQLAAQYRQARVVVAPLRFGAGVKGKVIEALAHGVPVVTSRFGVEGVPGLEQLITPADTPEAMAAAILNLLTNDAEWQRLSTAGQAFVQQHFSVAAAQNSMTQLFTSLEENHDGSL